MKSNKTVTRTGILTTLALLAGCFSDVPGQGDASPSQGDGAGVQGRRRELKGGTRLKARIITGEDGSEAAVGYYDTKLGVNCAFSMADDDKLRCLPTDIAKSTMVTSASGAEVELYLNATCTRIGGLGPLCDSPAKYIRITNTQGCGPGRIAEAVWEPGTLYLRSSPGVCTPYSVFPLGARTYSVGRFVAASEFVEGTQTLE